MKKYLTILMALMLCASMLAPQFALPAVSYADTQEKSIPETIQPDSDPADPAAEDFEIDPYLRVSMAELWKRDKLIMPDTMKDVGIEETANADGLLLSGKTGDLTSGKIVIDNEFDFSSAPVGRLSFDGLRDKTPGMSVQVGIYLDDGEEPVAAVSLRKQMGKKGWSNPGEQSIDLIGSEITGKHRVSLGIIISGNVPKKTSVVLRSVEFCATELPVMYFHIDESEGTIAEMNNSPDHSFECSGTVDLKVPDVFRNDPTFSDEYDIQDSITGLDLEYIRGRGNSTWDANKKPYKVKFDKSQDLFGFGKSKHWILLANRYDNSFVRNRMTFWLGRRLGMEYTPQCVPVEVVMNGDYYGSYLLCEQIRIGKGRVEIDDLDDVDGPLLTDEYIKTGGYLLSMRWRSEEDEGRYFTTDHSMDFYVESPEDNFFKYYKESEEDEPDQLFRKYITSFVQNVEDAIFGRNFRSETGTSYTDLLDMDAAVDYWWIQEFSENGDAYNSNSTYLYKKRDTATRQEKLYWGPLWDFDYVAWGDLCYGMEAPDTLRNTSNAWSYRMMRDREFIDRIRARWSAEYAEQGADDTSGRVYLRDLMEEITREGGLLDRYEKQMERSYTYDHEKYGAFESELTEYSGEIGQLRDWIIDRTAKVDKAVSELDAIMHTVTYILDGEVIREELVPDGDMVCEMPEVPSEKDGLVFSGWVDQYDNTFNDEYEIFSDLILTARYIRSSDLVQPKSLFFTSYDIYYKMDSSEYNYSEEEQLYLDYKVMPDDAWTGSVKWTSSDENIATVDQDGIVTIKTSGDVRITAALQNGVRNTCRIHILGDDEYLNYPEDVKFNKSSLTLRSGSYSQLLIECTPVPYYDPDYMCLSLDDSIATIDGYGIVKAKKPGITQVLMITSTEEGGTVIRKCKVIVRPNKGDIVKYKGSSYRITSAGSSKSAGKASLTRAANSKTVTVPAYIRVSGRKYSVTSFRSGAFAKSKASKVIVKTKKLTAPSVKGSLRKSKVKTIKVSTGKSSSDRKYVKKYRKIFTKKNAGKKVVVK